MFTSINVTTWWLQNVQHFLICLTYLQEMWRSVQNFWLLSFCVTLSISVCTLRSYLSLIGAFSGSCSYNSRLAVLHLFLSRNLIEAITSTRTAQNFRTHTRPFLCWNLCCFFFNPFRVLHLLPVAWQRSNFCQVSFYLAVFIAIRHVRRIVRWQCKTSYNLTQLTLFILWMLQPSHFSTNPILSVW